MREVVGGERSAEASVRRTRGSGRNADSSDSSSIVCTVASAMVSCASASVSSSKASTRLSAALAFSDVAYCGG